MQTSGHIPQQFQSELTIRHRRAARTIVATLFLTLVLPVIAYLGNDKFGHAEDRFYNIAVRITMVFCGLGSVAWRRTKFSTLRLQDITALYGVSGLLRSLEKTTTQLAVLGGLLSLFGFGSTLMTSNDFYTYGACLVSLVVLGYSYPTRSSWERAIRQFGQFEPQPPPPSDLQDTER